MSGERSADRRAHQATALLRLAVERSRRGAGAVFGGIVAAAIVVIASAVAAARSVRAEALPQVVLVAGVALAWGSGIAIALGAAVHALNRDRTDGFLALALARGVTRGRYGVARVLGLATVLALVVVGGVTIVGLVALGLVDTAGGPAVLRAVVASIAYGLAFAVLFASLAMAIFGTRSLARGYLVAVVLGAVSEGFAQAARSAGAYYVADALSVEGALAALRASLLARPFGIVNGLSGVAGVAFYTILAVVSLRAQLRRLNRDAEAAR